MIPVKFSGGTEGFYDVSRFEADRLAREAGATQCRNDGYYYHYFIEDRLEVGNWHSIMRVWYPIVREWDVSFFDKTVLCLADFD